MVADGLSIGYRTKKKESIIAENLYFGLGQGELTAVVGPNGIGKSTLLRTLAKIQPKLSGSIHISGKPLAAYRTAALAKSISLVLTDPIASKNMTVYEMIALGRQPYTNWIGSLTSRDKEKILEAITLLDLNTLAYQKCHTLSDGQLQRALIARALAQDTDIILMDEPTTHLDLHHKVHLLQTLQKIAKETQRTVLFTSHEITLSIELCDTMLLLGTQGPTFGTPEQLIQMGAFDNLFPADSISFQAETRSFKIKD